MPHKKPPSLDDTILSQLEHHNEFIRRHIGPAQADIDVMLADLGETSLENLVGSTLPADIQLKKPLDLPRARGEYETLRRLRAISHRNRLLHNMIGMGYHETITPTVIQRNVLENPGWYTAYTPYQAEISQGRLEALLNFQQMIADLSGMELANASLLDEATAAAEAMTMAHRVNRKNKSKRFLVDPDCLPQTIDVLRNRAAQFGIQVDVSDPATSFGKEEYFGALLQYPGVSGAIQDWTQVIEQAHQVNCLITVATDLLSLVLLKSPGEMGADIVVGNAQRFGVPMAYGGPHAAFFATREQYIRSLPGRIIGVTRDQHDRPALRMALQTREQHIRRDKATSNICTAQALLAVMSGFYGVYHGPGGLQRIAGRVHRLTRLLAAGLDSLGFKAESSCYFDTLYYSLREEQSAAIYQRALDAGINLRRTDSGGLGISINETTLREHIETLWSAFAGAESGQPELATMEGNLIVVDDSIPESLVRKSAFMEHPVFHRFHSETEMLRYLKKLENRDLSLAHAMISLGSCTMKLNATTEMLPISWPEFSNIHPFAPLDQTTGYQQLFKELETMLIACTGYDVVSLQPNAGSQGEYSGLLAIKGWHEANGDAHRNVCLIPSSAHGTNPASAAMAGMKIVVVKCDDDGNVDVDDLRSKAEQHKENLSALMITYPSTHGVFETRIREICQIVHDSGGQVYLDGANLNALVGCAEPGKFGADVSHLNLHKTFCIPHGGGGPGVGPICAGQHLAPHLPGHSQVKLGAEYESNPAVSAAPWGSAGILPISWVYIAMMGRDGMKLATQVAILSANYIAHHLAANYDVLYTGRNDRVAHECIIDLRAFKDSCGITDEDVAKRLIDYGFHAPTMSFPVPGTLMIEPTESESKAELDRFIAAMLSIRAEIQAIEDGSWDAEDNPLVNAPHTSFDIAADDWPHNYSRQLAAYPATGLQDGKFWPPVSRVDNVFGDRNLHCSCPPVSDWLEPDDKSRAS